MKRTQNFGRSFGKTTVRTSERIWRKWGWEADGMARDVASYWLS